MQQSRRQAALPPRRGAADGVRQGGIPSVQTPPGSTHRWSPHNEVLGASLAKGDASGVVESVKAASEIYAPVSGEIVVVNAALVDAPQTVNADPAGAGWFYRIKLSDLSQLDGLMDEAAYKAHAGG